MSTRSAISATSTARRCSSICTPAASSATAFFNRASSAVSRSGARCSIVPAACSRAPSRPPSSAASAAPSRARMPISSWTARSAIGSTSVHLAFELEALLQLLRRRHELARPRQVQRDGRLALWRLDPARRDRHMASLEQLTQPLPQRSLDPAELEWQLELRIEVAVVHAADLDREPPAEDLPFGRTETRHAPRHRL